ncbi:MAG: hypothetical protein QOI41_1293 [Myxococcales bacterium]|jgi:hypothetical protein|nr:hypothetical protein [Myxococcales bacterium]
MAAFGASHVLVAGRSRRGLAVAVAIGGPALLALLCEVTGNTDLQDVVAFVAALEAIGFFFLPAIAPNGIGFVKGERRGPLRADRDGVVFRGRSLLPRAQIRNVAIEGLLGGRQIVHVTALRAKDDVHIEVEDEEKARALVAALDLDLEQHVATFSVEEDPLRGRGRWLAARLLIALGALLVAGGVLYLARRNEALLLALVPALLAYALLLPRARVRTDIALGADGLTLRHRGRQRSIALSTMREVTTVGNTATLVLNGEETLVLRFGADNDATASLQQGAFVTRLRRTLGRRHRPRDPGEALLAKGEQETSDWAKHLSTLARPDEGYRVATVQADTLWRIAEGVNAEPTARVGALVALHARLDDEARLRLKDLATRTAQQDLRAALEAAASGADPDEILAAYDRTRS